MANVDINVFCFELYCPKCSLHGMFMVTEMGQVKNKVKMMCSRCLFSFYIFGVEIKGIDVPMPYVFD